MDEEKLALFFKAVAHGTAAHKEWLLERFRTFWGVALATVKLDTGPCWQQTCPACNGSGSVMKPGTLTISKDGLTFNPQHGSLPGDTRLCAEPGCSGVQKLTSMVDRAQAPAGDWWRCNSCLFEDKPEARERGP